MATGSVLFKFQFWGVKQNLIPYVWQMVFAYVSIEGWIIDPYVSCFFQCSAEVLVLPHMLKLSMVTLWPVGLKWSYIGEGAFWCSLNLSQNVLEDSPIYSSSHSTLSHLYLYMTPLFFWMGSWSFEVTEVLDGIASFKVDLQSMFTAYLL